MSKQVMVGDRTTKELRDEILNRINYQYYTHSGKYEFPNSCDGDVLRMTFKLLKAQKEEEKGETKQ